MAMEKCKKARLYWISGGLLVFSGRLSFEILKICNSWVETFGRPR